MQNWQVTERLLDEAGGIVRQQVVMVGLTEAEARELAMELTAREAIPPPEGERLVYVVEEAV